MDIIWFILMPYQLHARFVQQIVQLALILQHVRLVNLDIESTLQVVSRIIATQVVKPARFLIIKTLVLLATQIIGIIPWLLHAPLAFLLVDHALHQHNVSPA